MPCCDDPKLIHAHDVSVYQDVVCVSEDGTRLVLSNEFREEDLEPDEERWFCATCGLYFEDEADAVASLTDPTWKPKVDEDADRPTDVAHPE